MPGSRRTRATWRAPSGGRPPRPRAPAAGRRCRPADRPGPRNRSAVETREQAEQAVVTRQLAVRDGDALPDPGRAQRSRWSQRVEDRPLVESAGSRGRTRWREFLKHRFFGARAQGLHDTIRGRGIPKLASIDRCPVARPRRSGPRSQGRPVRRPDYQWAGERAGSGSVPPGPHASVDGARRVHPADRTVAAPVYDVDAPGASVDEHNHGIPSYRARSPPRRWSGAAGSWCYRRRSAAGWASPSSGSSSSTSSGGANTA